MFKILSLTFWHVLQQILQFIAQPNKLQYSALYVCNIWSKYHYFTSILRYIVPIFFRFLFTFGCKFIGFHPILGGFFD